MQHRQGPPSAFVGVPFMAPPQPGHEFLLVRLQRAQAVPPAQRTPEVAAFIEAMQLDEEACALLPLVRAPGATDVPLQPALPADEATAQRVLLAALKFFRIAYACRSLGMPSGKAFYHLDFYLSRGCGALYPPPERCIPELGALLRQNSTAQAVGPYLWLYAAAWLLGAAMAATAREVIPRVQQFIDGRSPPQQRTAAQRAADNERVLNLNRLAEARCAGCGEEAQGLRKCARCRQVGYCR